MFQNFLKKVLANFLLLKDYFLSSSVVVVEFIVFDIGVVVVAVVVV